MTFCTPWPQDPIDKFWSYKTSTHLYKTTLPLQNSQSSVSLGQKWRTLKSLCTVSKARVFLQNQKQPWLLSDIPSKHTPLHKPPFSNVDIWHWYFFSRNFQEDSSPWPWFHPATARNPATGKIEYPHHHGSDRLYDACEPHWRFAPWWVLGCSKSTVAIDFQRVPLATGLDI